jgi:hypothetical protein
MRKRCRVFLVITVAIKTRLTGISVKRHRAAALQDAGAHFQAPLFPLGFGARQPYAVLPERTDFRQLNRPP